jgi:type II secretory pathway component PulF
MFTFVVPRFAKIFDSLEIELPLLTQIVISLGNAAEQYWWAVVLGFVGVAFVVRIGPKHSAVLRRGFDQLKLNVPVLGRVNRLLVQSSFVHNLSLMLRAGVPILDSLHLCRGVVGNVVMEDAVKDAELAVTEGRRISEALRGHEIVSSLTLRMMVIGEETGRLDETLHHVKVRFDDEIPRRIKHVFGVMEPLITLLLICVVGLVAASVFLPMFSLISGLGG